jgi:chemotaxis protein methyltransferase CheR
MSSPLSNDLLGELSDWATEHFGLRFPPDRWHELARGVASAALELGIPDLNGWAAALLGGMPGAAQARALANHLTIAETYFFRHPDSFRLLENEILPARLAHRRRQGRPLRLWSAACASGEEPYSVAMLLRHRFSDVPPEQVILHATDINSHVLARAEQGVYSEWSFRDTPEWVKPAFFHRQPNGRYQLRREIRRSVKFSLLNFASPLYPAEFGERADFDVILCRNVLMYFSAEWQDKIVGRLAQALAPGGWLLTGPCDVTPDHVVRYDLLPGSPGVWQKSDGAARPRDRSRVIASLNPTMPELAAALLPQPLTSLAVPVTTGTIEERNSLPVPLPPTAPISEPVTATATESEVASMRAQSHADRGELREALAACEAAIALHKTNPSYHYLHGCILQELDRPADAADAFRRVLFLEPDAVMAQFALGCLARRGSRSEDARRHFGVVLRMLDRRRRGEIVAQSDGLTVGRLRAVVENNLAGDAA